MKRILFCCVLAVLLLSGCAAKPDSTPTPTATPKASEDIAAADIRFYDSNNTPLALSDAFGQPILLKFWAAEHADAEAEMRALINAYKSNKDTVSFFLIDLTQDAEIEKELFRQHPELVPPFPCYFDPDGSCRKAYELSGTQGSFFIDRDGFLATWVNGSINEEALLFGLKMI